MAIFIHSRGPQRIQDRYRESIERVLRDIELTRTGKIVLKYNRQDRHRVIISPYLDAGGPNAFATAGNFLSSGTFSANRIASGSGSRIEFSVARSTFPENTPQGRADEVLLHELSHSLRTITGTQRLSGRRSTATFLAMASYETVEEFFAAMVASVHSSELGRAILGNHGRWPLRNPEVLKTPPFSTRMRQICERMPEFAGDMALIPETVAPFNPFRDEINRTRVTVNPVLNTFFPDWI